LCHAHRTRDYAIVKEAGRVHGSFPKRDKAPYVEQTHEIVRREESFIGNDLRIQLTAPDVVG